MLAIASVALNVPAAFGLKRTLITVLCPAARVIGRPGAVTAKYFVEIATLLMVAEAAPELVTVVETVLVLPALTLPKFTDVFAKESKPLPLCC